MRVKIIPQIGEINILRIDHISHFSVSYFILALMTTASFFSLTRLLVSVCAGGELIYLYSDSPY